MISSSHKTISMPCSESFQPKM